MIHLPSFFWHVVPVFLYAETHYRFKYFFSFLRKHEPEIIADAPHRLDPNTSLPILILVKDANLFPAKLNRIRLVIKSQGSVVREKSLLNSPVEINQKLWWKVFEIDVNGLSGPVECDITFEVNAGNQYRVYHNDNHKTSSHRPMNVYISSTPLPRFQYLHFGECHSHSTYTDDQVEFGSPLGASVHLCKPIGLSFFCVTDHSYDLDDSPDNYLVNDPHVPKWEQLQNEVSDLNSMLTDFTIIRGEEATCFNSAKQNVHMLLLGNKRFFAGKGDGAEHWLNTKSEYFFDEILEKRI